MNISYREFRRWCYEELIPSKLVNTLKGQTCIMALEILDIYPQVIRGRVWRRMDKEERISEECVFPLAIRLKELELGKE